MYQSNEQHWQQVIGNRFSLTVYLCVCSKNICCTKCERAIAKAHALHVRWKVCYAHIVMCVRCAFLTCFNEKCCTVGVLYVFGVCICVLKVISFRCTQWLATLQTCCVAQKWWKLFSHLCFMCTHVCLTISSAFTFIYFLQLISLNKNKTHSASYSEVQRWYHNIERIFRMHFSNFCALDFLSPPLFVEFCSLSKRLLLEMHSAASAFERLCFFLSRIQRVSGIWFSLLEAAAHSFSFPRLCTVYSGLPVHFVNPNSCPSLLESTWLHLRVQYSII